MSVGLRKKLVFGFGGLLLILLAVGTLSLFVLNRYSGTMARFLSENYRSVVYAQNMKDDLEKLDGAAKRAYEGGASGPPGDAAAADDFAKNLKAQDANITLHPREDQLSKDLNEAWARYRIAHATVLNPKSPAPARREALRSLEDDSARLKQAAQEIIAINLTNMVVEDGQVRTAAEAARRAMYVLLAIGVALAAAFVWFLARSILKPLQALTRSAREIEQGNLDLVVRVQARDEVGQLAEAFNSMAARLREFRRTDRAKLFRTQRTTQLAVNSLPDAVAILSPDGTVELANEAARKLFQLRPGANIDEANARDLGELYRRVARDGRALTTRGYESTIQVFDEGGQERFFLPQAVPIIDPEKQLAGVTLVLADVTNLRRLDEMKSGMLSVVSHELKTPLTSMRLAVHLLLEERVGPLTAKQAELLLAAQEDSGRLQKIIENLLDMGRLESGRSLMEFKATPAESLVSGALEPMRSSFHDRGVAVESEVPAETPAVLADGTRIGHVFSNLLTNALKFTPPGGRVRVTAGAGADDVRFTVEDTGPGIAPQYVGRIFERFFRAPGQSGQSGAGLGLAIAKEIVEAHGGRIWVETRPGEGSKFCFTLRRADRNAGRDGEEIGRRTPAAGGAAAGVPATELAVAPATIAPADAVPAASRQEVIHS